MLSLSRADKTHAVLEPCSGAGVFLDVLGRAGFSDVEAVEIDETLASHEIFEVRNESFVSAPFDRKFRLVIGNPPYIRWRNLGIDAKRELAENVLWNRHFTSLSDYLTIFIARSIELLEDGGELIFITPSFWMFTMHSKSLRDFIVTQGQITDIIDFGEAEVFPKVGSSILIFRFQKGMSSSPGVVQHLRWTGRTRVDVEGMSLQTLVSNGNLSLSEIPPFEKNKAWVLASHEAQEHIKKFELACSVRSPEAEQNLFDPTDFDFQTFGDLVRIGNGMVSGLDAAFRLPPDLELSPLEEKHSIAVAKGFAIEPFRVNEESRYLFPPSGLTPEEFESSFPAFALHLEPFKPRLQGRYDYGRDLPYWEWAFLRNFEFFSQPTEKLFVPCKDRLTKRNRLRFAVVRSGIFPTQDVTAISLLPNVRESLYFFAAMLNSQPMYEWVRLKGLMKGGVAEFSERPITSLPARLIDWNNPNEVAIHNRIDELARSYVCEPDPNTRIEIDTLVESLLN